MSDIRPGEQQLDAELAQLRAALRTVEAPPPDEAALRAAFREATQRRARDAARSAKPQRVRFAAAAVVLVAAAGGLAALLLNGQRSPPGPWQASASPAAPLVVTAFQPLQSSPRFLPTASYSVVRVRIPLSAFALAVGSEQDGTIEADLLVGEDGLARGIRFIEADAWLASAQQ
jgi:hypothetical protein